MIITYVSSLDMPIYDLFCRSDPIENIMKVDSKNVYLASILMHKKCCELLNDI